MPEFDWILGKLENKQEGKEELEATKPKDLRGCVQLRHH